MPLTISASLLPTGGQVHAPLAAEEAVGRDGVV